MQRRHRLSKNLTGILSLILLLGPLTARGTTDKFPAFDLWPTVGDRSFFAVSSSQVLYQFQYSFDLSNAFVSRPLDLVNPAGQRLRSVIDYSFGHFLSAGIGLMDFWQIGFTLPIFTQSRFESPTAEPSPGAENLFKIGDLRFATKARLLDSNRRRFGIALEPFATIPLGADDRYLGDSKPTGGLRVIGDILLTDRIRLALNLGAEIRERVVISNVDFGSRFLSGLGVSAHLGRGITLSAETQANTAFKSFFSDKASTPVEFLGGVQWEIGQTGLKVGLGGGSCAVCGVRGAKARGFLNIGYRRLNESYLLKEKREEEMRVVTLGGIPEPTLEPYEIYELVEKCPIESGKYQIGRDDPRCTEIYDLWAIAEECPESDLFDPRRDNPKCYQIYSLRGQDSDGDDVPDFKDRCPTEKGDISEGGCPSRAFLIVMPEERQILTQEIRFDFAKATLRPDALPILNTLAGALHAQPAIHTLSIEGHTDEVGSEAFNNTLSHARARTVYEYLIEQGINPERLAYKGYGKRRPRYDNTIEEGREKNRRVEFIIRKVGAL